MKSSQLLDRLRKICEDRALTLVVHAGGHWQILGGPKIVNRWPMSAGCTVHVSGEKSGRSFFDGGNDSLHQLVDLVFN